MAAADRTGMYVEVAVRAGQGDGAWAWGSLILAGVAAMWVRRRKRRRVGCTSAGRSTLSEAGFMPVFMATAPFLGQAHGTLGRRRTKLRGFWRAMMVGLIDPALSIILGGHTFIGRRLQPLNWDAVVASEAVGQPTHWNPRTGGAFVNPRPA